MNNQKRIETDIIGKRYGRLTVISYSHKEKVKNRYKHYYNCDCECGKRNILVERNNLIYGNTKSCSCIRSEMLIKWNIDNKGFTPPSF